MTNNPERTPTVAPGKEKPKTATKAFAALTIALAVMFVKPWEGSSPPVYKDIVGIPTVCYGHTGSDVVMGQKARTPEQCSLLLSGDISIAYKFVQKCITVPIWPEQAAAFSSLAFNAGGGALCGSTLQKKANAGDLAGACAQILRWDYAGGRRVPGLTNRRQAEYKLCMTPMSKK